MVNHISDSAMSLSKNVIAKITGAEKQIDVTPNKTIEASLEGEQLNLPSEKAKKMTDSMNKFLETTSTELRFKFHEELNTYYVTLIDANTEEIVREIPSKKLMDMYAAMRDFVGFFVDEKI
ncbi:flagellar protein FlaG [Psychrobacillus sp. BL-248-WT-3]|uniref:flagellar protein FlaG n=1 Tax=Psychrobacillus sp. BL-248-WT-3 TaxID=2725306 RepID=UPI001F0DAA4D|nr:flagellar protein FlaG [Psychrobacillus sp. BL-248-WT-3]